MNVIADEFLQLPFTRQEKVTADAREFVRPALGHLQRELFAVFAVDQAQL
jgi:hypothetical protein